MPDNNSTLLLRFRVNDTVLGGLTGLVMGFEPWRGVETWLRQTFESYRVPDKARYTPYAQLRTVCAVVLPSTVQGFDFDRLQGQYQPLMVLPMMNPPAVTDIARVVGCWFENWLSYIAQDCMPDQLAGLLAELRSRLQEVRPVSSKQELLQAWRNQDVLNYRLLPAYLARRLHGKSCLIPGREDLRWHMVHGPNGKVGIVSDPLLNRGRGDGSGLFSYSGEFVLQSMPGHREPSDHRVAILWHCRRYMRHGLEKKAVWNNRVHIYMQNDGPRFEPWEGPGPWVALPVEGNLTRGWRWVHGTSDVLVSLKVRSVMPDAGDVLARPTDYIHPGDGRQDLFYVPMREGARPDHPLATGLSQREKGELTCGVLSHLHDVLVEDPALIPDGYTIPRFDLRNRVHRVPLCFLPPRALACSQPAIASAEQAKTRSDQHKVRVEWAREYEITRRREVLGLQELRVMVCCGPDRYESTVEMVAGQINMLFRGRRLADTAIPGLEVIPLRIPPHLIQPLSAGPFNPYAKHDKAFREGWGPHVRTEWKKKVQEWHGWLQTNVPEDAGANQRVVALVELPDLVSAGVHPDLGIKTAVRRAFNDGGIRTQMLYPLRGAPQARMAKLNNSLGDLLLRQLGLVYGDLTDLWMQTGVGLPDDQAEEFSVIGLLRVRARAGGGGFALPAGFDVGVAVRLSPNGTVEACVPDRASADRIVWQPMPDAIQVLGEQFRAAGGGKQPLSFQHLWGDFLWAILHDANRSPSLVILRASDWRQKAVCPGLANPEIQLNRLTVRARGALQTLPASALPNVRIVRVNDAGARDELPDYLYGPGHSLAEIRARARLQDLSLYEDPCAPGTVRVFMSIARLSKLAGDDEKLETPKRGAGGAIAHKQASVLEIAPIFYQVGDDPVVLARMVHALRDMASWWGDSLLLPYPLHVAAKAIDDQRDAIGPDMEEEGAEE